MIQIIINRGCIYLRPFLPILLIPSPNCFPIVLRLFIGYLQPGNRFLLPTYLDLHLEER